MNTNHLNNTINIQLTPEELTSILTATATVKAILEGNHTDLEDWKNNVYGQTPQDIQNLRTGLTTLLLARGDGPDMLKAYLG